MRAIHMPVSGAMHIHQPCQHPLSLAPCRVCPHATFPSLRLTKPYTLYQGNKANGFRYKARGPAGSAECPPMRPAVLVARIAAAHADTRGHFGGLARVRGSGERVPSIWS